MREKEEWRGGNEAERMEKEYLGELEREGGKDSM